MKTWKLPTPAKIADRLKSALLGEMANAEWELLEEKEWDDEEAQDKHTKASVPRDPDGHSARDIDHETSTTTTELTSTDGRKHVDDGNVVTKPSIVSRPSGTSGWTKLKSKQ